MKAPPFLKEIDISGYLMTMPAMTHEERATWIRRIFILLLSRGSGSRGLVLPENRAAAAATRRELKRRAMTMEIIHYHDPENPQSVEIAESLNEIGKKYAMQVLVTRVDIRANPDGGENPRGGIRAPRLHDDR